MNFIELVQFAEELYALVQELKADGTYQKILDAEQAIQTELQTNTRIMQLITKAEGFFAKKPTKPVIAPKA